MLKQALLNRSPIKQSDLLLIDVHRGDPRGLEKGEKWEKNLPGRGGGGWMRACPTGGGITQVVTPSEGEGVSQVGRPKGAWQESQRPHPTVTPPSTGQASSSGEPVVRSGEKGDAIGRHGPRNIKPKRQEGRTGQFDAVLSWFPQRQTLRKRD